MKKLVLLLILFIITVSIYAQASSDKLIREGVSLHDKKRYKEAITCFQGALELNPTSMSATYEMSLSYLLLKDYENALKYSTKVINANFQPLLVDAYIVKSSAFAETKRIDKSILLLNEAIDRCGDEYLLHFNLGLSYFNQKDTRMSVLHLRKAIEIDATHASAFLLYAYALNDSGKWMQSFYAFHFFLLLEPNTERSKEAFSEMYDLIANKSAEEIGSLTMEDGVDKKQLFAALQEKRPTTDTPHAQYLYFEEASKTIFFALSQLSNNTQSGLLWNFFVPTYDEILGSPFFDAYCRYVSVSYFPESLEWWAKNKDEVDKFIEWFETGQGDNDDEADYGDDSDIEILVQ